MSDFDLKIPVSAAKLRHDMDVLPERGYTRFMQGVVHIEKAEQLFGKFVDRYAMVGCPKKRYKQKQKTRCASVLMYMYPIDRTNTLEWFCIATDGAFPHESSDPWSPLRGKSKRLTFDGKYELKRLVLTKDLAKAYAEHGNLPKHPMWTWAMTSDYRKQWQAQIRDGVNTYAQFGTNRKLVRTIELLNSLPGHRGVREDVFKLFGGMYRQLNASKLATIKSPETIPDWAVNKQRTIEFFKCRETSLRTCAWRFHNGEETWFPVPRPGQLRAAPFVFDREAKVPLND